MFYKVNPQKYVNVETGICYQVRIDLNNATLPWCVFIGDVVIKQVESPQEGQTFLEGFLKEYFDVQTPFESIK